ncbi:MAG: hypothetical protein RDV48_19930 [Candidatus Eremiobacteraeota bacterium]|nr:hypothetical protein [Candidatus Eremiobacteraeota bacterium]
MADYTDPTEVDEIDKFYANFPPIDEIVDMCIILGAKTDYKRTHDESKAWAYYYELKTMVEAKQRKTA